MAGEAVGGAEVAVADQVEKTCDAIKAIVRAGDSEGRADAIDAKVRELQMAVLSERLWYARRNDQPGQVRMFESKIRELRIAMLCEEIEVARKAGDSDRAAAIDDEIRALKGSKPRAISGEAHIVGGR